jgi:hypothetical protein
MDGTPLFSEGEAPPHASELQKAAARRRKSGG